MVDKLKAGEFAFSHGNIKTDHTKTSVIFSKPDSDGNLQVKITLFIKASQIHKGSSGDEPILQSTGNCGVFTFNKEYFKDQSPALLMVAAEGSEEIFTQSDVNLLTGGIKGDHGFAILDKDKKA